MLNSLGLGNGMKEMLVTAIVVKFLDDHYENEGEFTAYDITRAVREVGIEIEHGIVRGLIDGLHDAALNGNVSGVVLVRESKAVASDPSKNAWHYRVLQVPNKPLKELVSTPGIDKLYNDAMALYTSIAEADIPESVVKQMLLGTMSSILNALYTLSNLGHADTHDAERVSARFGF